MPEKRDIVLIVDDDEDVRKMLYKVIRGNGIDADTAASGEEALEKTAVNHYDLILLDVNMSGVDDSNNEGMCEIIHELGADSMTHYQFVHFTDIDRDYNEIMTDVVKEWDKIDRDYKMPYFPHVSCGWDNNPRYHSFRPGIVKNNTPENFESALREAKKYIDEHTDRVPLITINSWNEWTETSYLEPDDLYGYGYLEAIKKVFVDEK